MQYFKKVKENQEVFGLVFGHGKVCTVFGDGHFTFEVEYDNGHTVPYTPEGIPAWSGKLDFQTVYYKDDIDLMDHDITAANGEILTPKKIIKLRIKNKLEIKCPSGIWQSVSKCPSYIMEDYLESGKFNLFRKK